MSEKNAAIIRRWFDEVWNARRLDLMEELLSPDSRAYGLKDSRGGTPTGHEGFRELFHAFSSAFPDMRIIAEDIIVEGDKTVTRCTVTGTHLGEGLGIPPTGKKVAFTGLCLMHIKDDRITDVWNQFDFIKMYQQVGALSLTLD